MGNLPSLFFFFFKRKEVYIEHMLIHSGPRYRCTHCPKEFVQKSNLKRHIRQEAGIVRHTYMHSPAGVAIAKFCASSFGRIHLGIKPYKCNYCGKDFSDKGSCNAHVRRHTGEKFVSRNSH